MIAESDTEGRTEDIETERNKQKITVNLYYFNVSAQSFSLMWENHRHTENIQCIL